MEVHIPIAGHPFVFAEIAFTVWFLSRIIRFVLQFIG